MTDQFSPGLDIPFLNFVYMLNRNVYVEDILIDMQSYSA